MGKVILDLISDKLPPPDLDAYEKYLFLSSLNLFIKTLGKIPVK